jgi:hypothetical protein
MSCPDRQGHCTCVDADGKPFEPAPEKSTLRALIKTYLLHNGWTNDGPEFWHHPTLGVHALRGRGRVAGERGSGCEVRPMTRPTAATPGQERRAEALTTSAPEATIQHDPGRVHDHGRSDLDRHVEANATLAGLFRRAFIKGAR